MKFEFLYKIRDWINILKSKIGDDNSAVFDRVDPILVTEDDINSDNININDNLFVDSEIEFSIDIFFDPHLCGDNLNKLYELLLNIRNTNVRFLLKSLDGTIKSSISNNDSIILLKIVVALASRNGPISYEDWSYAYDISDSISSIFGSEFVCPSYKTVLSKGMQLDKLCSSIDAYFSLNLIMENAFGYNELIDIVSEFDFIRFENESIFLDNEDYCIFLSRDDGLGLNEPLNIHNIVSFTLDVPRSINDERLFLNFFTLVKKISECMGAKIVDDSGMVLSEDYIESIEDQLQSILEILEKNGFKAGSYRAKRIFR
ncbi:membrane protein [Candidatus Kinetoplastibacterium desouzaii TCC079E]|uniref:Membrane protein n=1 Tax=Candidatus Kinetoplastidibacterium desouzai TCC079E TaxID=1208919 RepID=M1L2Q3_9PROT|nr:cell division protein ZipA C-terminal FtsZ-binding domain-containing protein [Candidatus Kinetoplastibacterium desouzaii]AGF47033.1 membrane protein [Candidatus Kinetoplastibacterium desouzaii TCC079E]